MSSAPAVLGLVGGGVVFVLLLLPILIWQSRRYGTVRLRRVLGAAAVAVYGAALAAYTLLPAAPIEGDLAAWCSVYGYDGVNLNVLQFVDDIRRGTQGLSPVAALTSTVVLQLVLNAILFVPWGLLARGFLGWSRWACVGSAFACSLFIETTQASGVFGLIGCSYRFGDVDDLLTNTLGGLVGALAAPVVMRWMPQGRELARTRGVARPVTGWRRLLGMGVDWLAFTMVGYVAVVVYRVVVLASTGTTPPQMGVPEALLGGVVPWVLVFATPVATRSGASWGQRVAWLVPVPEDGRAPGRGRLVLRAAVPGGIWGLLSAVDMVPGTTGPGGGPVSAWGVAAAVLAVATVVSVPLTRDRRGLSGTVSGCVFVDERTAERESSPFPARTPATLR